jgi:hypothetical protein
VEPAHEPVIAQLPQFVRAQTDSGPVMAIAFTADFASAKYCPDPPEAELSDILAASVGHAGTMADYLKNTLSKLEKAGVHDPNLWHMEALVADRLARLPERGTAAAWNVRKVAHAGFWGGRLYPRRRKSRPIVALAGQPPPCVRAARTCRVIWPM